MINGRSSPSATPHLAFHRKFGVALSYTSKPTLWKWGLPMKGWDNILREMLNAMNGKRLCILVPKMVT
jgi:hypothetical protein